MALLIYGANGYTGELIARRAVLHHTDVVLAGRNGEAVGALSGELRLPHRIFSVDDVPATAAALLGIRAVLNCAGPFSRTAAALSAACLRAGVHYLDITGEVAVFEELAARAADARAAGVTLMPGAGFDVVPSDCLAAHVVRRLPSATHLFLAFSAGTTLSRGTALTSVENAHGGGLVRQAGKLVRVPSGWHTRTVDFGGGPRKVITIPWGDVATAYHTTGVPNIETYVALPWTGRLALRASRALGPLLASAAVKRRLEAGIRKRASAGPSADERARRSSALWAEARDADSGAFVQSRLRAPEPYELTSWTALDLAIRAARGDLPTGFQTPAGACGADYVLTFPGVVREDVVRGPDPFANGAAAGREDRSTGR